MLKKPGTRRAKNSINLAPWVLSTLVWGLVHAVGSETYAAPSHTIPRHPRPPPFRGFIQANSIDTGNERRDNHLRSADFFDVAKYPRIEFASTSVQKGVEDRLEVTGTLSLHGVTKPVTFPVEVLGVGVHPMNGKAVAGFAAELTVKCSEYGVDNWTDAAGVLGDEVKMTVLIEALGGE